MADDLVQRALKAADESIEPHAKHLLPEGTRHYVYDSEMRELLHALADALARKDAEISGLREIIQRDSAELRSLCAARDQARRTSEYWKAEHTAANAEIAELRSQVAAYEAQYDGIEAERNAMGAIEDERDTLRQRAEHAEARVREAPVVTFDREDWMDHMLVVSPDYIGKRVALVLLETEEG